MKGCLMPNSTIPISGRTTVDRRRRVAKAPSSDMNRLLRRSRPWRCLGIAVMAVAAGWGLLTVLLPYISAESITHLLEAHLPAGGTPPLLFWLRLCRSRLPFWLLMAVAGFTRFSGGLTSAVTVYRGLCDGAVIGLLFSSVARGASPHNGQDTVRLLYAFGTWAAMDLAVRLAMALGARHVAGMEWNPTGADGRMAPAVRKALTKYLVLCLGWLCATAAACGVYTAFIYM